MPIHMYEVIDYNICMPPSLRELTQTIFNMGLTHLCSEASIYYTQDFFLTELCTSDSTFTSIQKKNDNTNKQNLKREKMLKQLLISLNFNLFFVDSKKPLFINVN